MSGRGRKRRPDGPADAEADLWRRYAETLEPVKRKPRVPGVAPAETEQTAARAAERARSGGDGGGEIAGNAHPASSKTRRRHHEEQPQKFQPSPLPASRAKAPPLADFDRRKARQIASGKVEIDGRLDLHGMTQSEAHGTLVAYLHAAYAKGRRVVLVITGKGDDADDGHELLYERMVRRGRGVLRRTVPQWLQEPELRGVVSSFTTASIRHGGSGALYVHLRKRPTPGER